jgi:hypothetical protein
VAGNVYSVELEYHRVPGFFGRALVEPGGGTGGFLGVELSWASLQPPSNFAKYDTVVVCAGTSNQYEGEGYDRPYQLPEFQDELIQNISNVKPERTIVVTNGGGSVDVQPWINQIGALVHLLATAATKKMAKYRSFRLASDCPTRLSNLIAEPCFCVRLLLLRLPPLMWMT